MTMSFLKTRISPTFFKKMLRLGGLTITTPNIIKDPILAGERIALPQEMNKQQ